MPDNYGGVLQTLLAEIPAAVNISSSTNTSPISVTTAAPHGCETGDTFVVHDHEVNTAANGAWQVVKTSANTLLLVGSTGNGVGGATGLGRCAGFGVRYQIPSDLDRPNAASVNVGFEALGDRGALLFYLLQYAQTVHGGGTTTYNDAATLRMKDGSTLKLDAGALINAIAGCLLQGVLDLGDFTIPGAGAITVTGHSTISVLNQALLEVLAGATFNLAGTGHIQSLGKLVADSGALIEIKGDGTLSGAGDLIVRGADNAKLEIEGNAELQVDALGLLDLNGTLDAATAGAGFVYADTTTIVGSKTEATINTFTAKQVRQGAGAFVVPRSVAVVDMSGGNQTVVGSDQDWIEIVGPMVADHSLTLNSPPDHPVPLRIFGNGPHGSPSTFGVQTLTINDQGGTTIFKIVGTDEGDPKWVDLIYRGSGNWTVAASYKSSDGSSAFP